MDFSPNLHHQLFQLENQLLLDSGSNHVWNPDITLSSSSEFEANFDFEDLNPAIVDAERFTSMQHYYFYSNGSSKDKKFGEGKVEKEGSASCLKINETLSKSHCSNFEGLNKIAQSCCCTKIHPTVNVSSRKPLMAELSTSLGFDHSLSLASSHHLLQQSTTSPLLTKMPSYEITPTKRACILKEQNPTQSPSKKMRVESRATCPPLKIRKDKLGDRIAALQQLVSPFGKTDTASVLMESITYINFLQNQVELLSHCYLKTHRTKNYKTICQDDLNEKDKKLESDLKVKGLCVVPLTWVSYLPEDSSTGGRIGSIWPPLPAASFNRRTC